GLHLRTYVTPALGLQLTLGFALDNQTVDVGGTDTDVSAFSFRSGLHATYKLAYWQRGHLSALAGLNLVTRSESAEAGGVDLADESGLDLLVDLGLMGEFFPTQYISLFLQGGLSL